MADSTPNDIAAAFRSLARRRREALEDAGDTAGDEHVAQLQGHVDAAAALLGTEPDPAAIADAIDGRPASTWDDDSLNALRQHADGLGGMLRRLAAMSGDDDPDE